MSQVGTPEEDFAGDVDTDRSGEVVVLGCQSCFSTSARRLVVRRYDATGNLLWKRSVVPSADHVGHRLAVHKSSGDTYVVGYVHRAGPPSFGPAPFVTKFDRAGNREWERQPRALDTINGVAVTREGTVFVVGWIEGDAGVTAFSPAGVEGDTLRFGTTGNDGATDVAFDGSGYVYVAGTTTGTFPGQTGGGGNDVFVRKFNRFGTEIWTRQYASALDQNENQPTLAVERFGVAYVAGTRIGNGNRDVYVRAYNASGTWMWERVLGSAEPEVVYDLDVDRHGSVHLGGATYGPLADPSAAPGAAHALVATYDRSGTLTAITQFETPDGSAALLGIALGPRSLDPQPLYVAGGATGAFAGQVNAGDSDTFVLRMR